MRGRSGAKPGLYRGARAKRNSTLMHCSTTQQIQQKSRGLSRACHKLSCGCVRTVCAHAANGEHSGVAREISGTRTSYSGKHSATSSSMNWKIRSRRRYDAGVGCSFEMTWSACSCSACKPGWKSLRVAAAADDGDAVPLLAGSWAILSQFYRVAWPAHRTAEQQRTN